MAKAGEKMAAGERREPEPAEKEASIQIDWARTGLYSGSRNSERGKREGGLSTKRGTEMKRREVKKKKEDKEKEEEE